MIEQKSSIIIGIIFSIFLTINIGLISFNAKESSRIIKIEQLEQQIVELNEELFERDKTITQINGYTNVASMRFSDSERKLKEYEAFGNLNSGDIQLIFETGFVLGMGYVESTGTRYNYVERIKPKSKNSYYTEPYIFNVRHINYTNNGFEPIHNFVYQYIDDLDDLAKTLYNMKINMISPYMNSFFNSDDTNIKEYTQGIRRNIIKWNGNPPIQGEDY